TDPDAHETPTGVVIATICYLAPRTDDDFAELFTRVLSPLLAAASAKVLASLVTERGPNTFPRLPVREGETVFVWFSGFESVPAYEEHLAALAHTKAWTNEAEPEMDPRSWRRNEFSRFLATTPSPPPRFVRSA